MEPIIGQYLLDVVLTTSPASASSVSRTVDWYGISITDTLSNLNLILRCYSRFRAYIEFEKRATN